MSSLNTKGKDKHSKGIPFTFKENGAAMFSALLNAEITFEINIAIVRVFAVLKQLDRIYEEITELTNIPTNGLMYMMLRLLKFMRL